MNIAGYAPETIAIAFMVMVGIAAIIFMIVMLFRILSETQGGYSLVMERSLEMSRAGESLGEVMGVLEEILLKLNSLKTQYELGAHASNPVISPEAVRALERLLKTLPSYAMKELEAILAEMRRLLASIQGVAPEAYSQWIVENRPAIEKVLGQEGITSLQAAEIEEVLIETEPLITQWVREAKMAETVESPEMKAMLNQQEQLLKEARSRAREAEDKLKLLTQQVDNLLSQQARHKAQEKEEIERLRTQNADLTRERSSLMRHLENLSGEIKRTRLEKKFIEDRFVDMDEQARSENTEEGAAI